MSDVIAQLAKIDFDEQMLAHADVTNIYNDFNANYRRLDDLKNFRSDYDKKNKLMRWWHNDKLRDAQLDSSEVQAEFSKTIGQLMLIGIAQSRKLTQQQGQLNEQQSGLSKQASGIIKQAEVLEMQHHTLAEQNKKLEDLVNSYFELKGLTEDGARKLISIANDVKKTKDDLINDFVKQTNELNLSMHQVSTNAIKTHQHTIDTLEKINKSMRFEIANSTEKMNEQHAVLQNETAQAITIHSNTINNLLANYSEKLHENMNGITDNFKKVKINFSTLDQKMEDTNTTQTKDRTSLINAIELTNSLLSNQRGDINALASNATTTEDQFINFQHEVENKLNLAAEQMKRVAFATGAGFILVTTLALFFHFSY